MRFPFIKNTEKTEVKIDRKTNKTTKHITYYMKLIDNFRFMSTLLSNTIENHSDKLHGKIVIIVNVFGSMKKLKTICYYIVV